AKTSHSISRGVKRLLPLLIPRYKSIHSSEKFGNTTEAAMDKTDPSEKMIRQYLLGELSESEQTALEDECFADGAKYDRLLQAEDKLIDDYARGYLSAAERLQFERHFMGTPRRCEHVRFARAFTALLDQEHEAQAPPQTEQASPLHHPGAPV